MALPDDLRKEVQAQDCRPRLDQVLARLFPDWSRRRLKALLREGRVKLNGQVARPRSQAQPGDHIELIPIQHGDGATSPMRPQLLHESSNFLYVYKPSGLHSIALDPGPSNTLAFALQHHFPASAQASSDPRDGGAIHRLDAQTSGVVAVAKHPQAYTAGRAAMGQAMGQAMSKCGPLKQYLAVVQPVPRAYPALARAASATQERGSGLKEPDLSAWGPDWSRVNKSESYEILAPLGRKGGAERVGIDACGRECRSQMQVLAQREAPDLRRLVLLTLHTGMRHQLRVHLAMLGLPIINDPLYGPRTEPTGRLALHAWRLDLGEIDKGCGPIMAPVGLDFLHAANTGSPRI